LRAKKVSVSITDEPTPFADRLGNVGGTVCVAAAAIDKVCNSFDARRNTYRCAT
jgi:hypothetical protein